MRSGPNRIALLAILVTGIFTAPAGAGPIDRIEPPFWWQGFEHDELQIMVHGHGVGDFDVAVDYPGVTLDRIERVDSNNYLFIYVGIDDDAEPGTVQLAFDNGQISFVHDYELKAKNPDPAHVGSLSGADVIYLITPDRFANGDPSNDTIEELGDVKDRGDDFGRHGGDLKGISANLDYIQELGYTAVWLNPVLENAMPEASYHGYATTDFYRVDPRYGSNEDYRALADEMRSKDMRLVMDMIVNHSGLEHWWMDDLPRQSWINNPGTLEKPEVIVYSSHARTTNQDPYAADIDIAEHADGWFSPDMPDLNQRDPLLADYLVQNAIWWIEYLGLSGIRMDTYPYPDKHFMSEWTHRVMREYPQFTITGEEWSPNPAIVSYWQRGKINHDGYESSLPSVLDFPLQIAFSDALTRPEPSWGSVWTPVYEMLGNDFLYPAPFELMTFPDNHDMSRIFTQVDEDYDLYRIAMVFYATMRGIPSFYYGTEVLMSHPGTESHGAIRAEFPGGWRDHDKNAFTGAGLTDQEQDAQAFTRKLLNWRKDADVIHDGQLMQYAPLGNVYVYFRYDDDNTVMVAFNRGTEAATLDLERFSQRIGDHTRAVDVLSGRVFRLAHTLTIDPRSVLVLEAR